MVKNSSGVASNPVMLDINSSPPRESEGPLSNSTSHLLSCTDFSRSNNVDGTPIHGHAKAPPPQLNSAHLNNNVVWDVKQFMPAFDGIHSLGSKYAFTTMEKGTTGSVSATQRLAPIFQRKRDFSMLSSCSNTEYIGASSSYPSSGVEHLEIDCSDNKKSYGVPKYLMEESRNHLSSDLFVVLPIQYGDFFITNLGQVDLRGTYHSNQQIWPIGFTSYWHDKLSGSLFETEIVDGGATGPIFKVRRLPCSAFPLPSTATILTHVNVRKGRTFEELEHSSLIDDSADNDYEDIHTLLADPAEPDFFSCFNSKIGECTSKSVGSEEPSIMASNMVHQSKGNGIRSNISRADTLGEFHVEARSSATAWKKIARALTEACRREYKQLGFVRFFCNHVITQSIHPGDGIGNYHDCHGPLTRFFSSSGPEIPEVIQDYDSESTYSYLEEWLNQDRSGLSMEFVQEAIEHLPGSDACPRYQLLSERAAFKTFFTVASGSLLPMQRNGEVQLNGIYQHMAYGRPGSVESSKVGCPQPPPGKSISSRLPPMLAGDVFQISEFLRRFSEILGLKEIPTFDTLERELIDPWPHCNSDNQQIVKESEHLIKTSADMIDKGNGSQCDEDKGFVFIPVKKDSAPQDSGIDSRMQELGHCSSVILTNIHISLLKILVNELLMKVSGFADSNIDTRESRPKRGRKRDAESALSAKELKMEMLTFNQLTWPEMGRRYILSISSLSRCIDSSDLSNHEGMKVFRCLHGDGGMLCGALSGIAGMEADALLLSEVERQISDSKSPRRKVLSLDCMDIDSPDLSETVPVDEKNLPEWALPLEPVKKLPTNVGTRIRRCVHDALGKNPPEWARRALEHSISKGVYKGNASGPTKKAVLAVLAEVGGINIPQKNLLKQKKLNKSISLSEAIMRKCQMALRNAVSLDESRILCNLLGSSLIDSSDNVDEGILGYPGMVSRPIDFRTIDTRLTVGAYDGSNEAFIEDVRELLRSLSIAYGEQADLPEIIEMLSKSIEESYEKQVMYLAQKISDCGACEDLDPEVQRELHAIIFSTNEMPKVPWEGLCKVCGLDKNDSNVLLCDSCDSEYHTYCLNPPLPRIPEGNWYCPSCATSGNITRDPQGAALAGNSYQRKRQNSGEGYAFQRVLDKLTSILGEKEYWEFTIEERILLLKFLCDEVLNTALVREHIEQCAEKSADLQQKFRALTLEWKNLKIKESLLVQTAKENSEKYTNLENSSTDETRSMCVNHSGLTEQGKNCNNVMVGMEDSQHVQSVQSDRFQGIECNTVHKDLKHSHDVATNSHPVITEACKNLIDGKDEMLTGLLSKGSCRSSNGGTSFKVEESALPPVVQTANGESIDVNTDAAYCSNQATHKLKLAESENGSHELGSLKDEISQLQESISVLESDLMMTGLRREYLGRDSLGRVYWAVGGVGGRPWLVADGSVLHLEDKNHVPGASQSSLSGSLSFGSLLSTFKSNLSSDKDDWAFSAFIGYKSNDEILNLLNWLKESDPREKALKECITVWQRFQFNLENCSSDHCQLPPSSNTVPHVSTKAALVLQKKYGSLLDYAGSELDKRHGMNGKTILGEEAMYRCECLEPVWPSRHHCASCHKTFGAVDELNKHNEGKCSVSIGDLVSDTNNIGLPLDQKLSVAQEECPYNLEEISKKFVINNSLKELVQQIGYIGPGGVPSFVPSVASYRDHVSVLAEDGVSEKALMDLVRSDTCPGSSFERSQVDNISSTNGDTGTVNENLPNSSLDNTTVSQEPYQNNMTRGLCVNHCTVPDVSLSPLVGRKSQLLKQLKIHLLDMDAALPEEAIRPSKSHSERRCLWRSFVKSAASIFEIVKATILLENMIKAEYLKNGWWYWSSLSAAAKIRTLSSLALRVYTLDDSIIYSKDVISVSDSKPTTKGKKHMDSGGT